MINYENSSTIVEKFQLGRIETVEKVMPEDVGIELDKYPNSIFSVEVVDPYVENYSPEEFKAVKDIEQEANNYAEARRLSGYWERRPRTVYVNLDNTQQNKKGWGDPISRDIFFDITINSVALNAWRSKIPSSQALVDISDPLSIQYITDKRGSQVPIDEEARKWLSLCTDAIAIRSRATIMAELVSEYVNNNKQPNYRWLSVACGTALPAMQGAMRANIKPELYLADFDVKALENTEKLAKEIGFDGKIKRPSRDLNGKDTINIFNIDDMSKLKDYLINNGGQPSLIDLMGIFEYTGDNLGVNSSKFLKSCYDILRPGGRLIFGQMRDDRNVPDFVTGVVGWPYVEMRSINQFMTVIKEAGILPDQTNLYLPKDGVYMVGVITKS